MAGGNNIPRQLFVVSRPARPLGHKFIPGTKVWTMRRLSSALARWSWKVDGKQQLISRLVPCCINDTNRKKCALTRHLGDKLARFVALCNLFRLCGGIFSICNQIRGL